MSTNGEIGEHAAEGVRCRCGHTRRIHAPLGCRGLVVGPDYQHPPCPCVKFEQGSTFRAAPSPLGTEGMP